MDRRKPIRPFTLPHSLVSSVLLPLFSPPTRTSPCPHSLPNSTPPSSRKWVCYRKARNLVDAIAMGMSIRSIWLRLLFNPTQSLCSIVNRHLAVLHQRTMIGIQLRVGGSKANYAEKEMLNWAGVEKAIQLVRDHMMKEKPAQRRRVLVCVYRFRLRFALHPRAVQELSLCVFDK